MPFQRIHWFVWALVALMLITACSGLGGEPRIIATLPPATTAPTEVGYPAETPDLALGSQVFAQYCTACHGAGGRGDGELIGSGEGQIADGPPDFTDPATTAEQTPRDWYTTITNGRMDKFMPPWREALTERERWAVAMYTYMLHYRQEVIKAGEVLLEELGLSPEPLSQAELVSLTDAQLVETVGNALSAEEGQQAAAYLRSQGLQNVGVMGQAVAAQPVTTPEPAPEGTPYAGGVTGMVSGQVANGTGGATVPGDLVVTLHVLDVDFNDTAQETGVDGEGRYRFESVTIDADLGYIVTAEYQQRTFGSAFVTGDPNDPTLELPLTIYEITNDPAVIDIGGIVTQIVGGSDLLQFAQVFSFRNTSDRAFSTDELLENEAYASVRVPLPSGAQLLSLDDSRRFVLSESDWALIDTAPVLPGREHLVSMTYSLPFSGERTVELPLDYSVSGPVRLLVAPEALRVESDQFTPLGPQTLRDATFQGYGVNGTLSAGDVIRYRIGGSGSSSLFTGVMLALGVGLLLAAGFLFVRGRQAAARMSSASPGDSQVLVDGLIQQIAELDAARAADQIDEETYQRRREKLKSRLADLMDKE